MYKLFIANTSIAAINAVIDQLERKNQAGSNHLVICPSNYGWSIEKLIHEKLNLEGSFNIKVSSFQRLSKEFAKSKKKRLGREGAVLLLRKVMLDNESQLKHYKKVAKEITFAGKIYNSVSLLSSNGITPDMLVSAATEKKDAISNKLNDLALIMEAFNREKQDKYIDDIERLDVLRSQIEENNYFEDQHIYILGQNDFSNKELEIIRAIEKKAKSVSIAMCRQGSTIPNRAIFPEQMIRSITGLINSEGAQVDEMDVVEVLKDPVSTLHGYVFSYDEPRYAPKHGNKIYAFKETNVYEEINAVAHEINRLVKRGGYRYKDITIASCCEKYQREIAHIFERYDIPVFVNMSFPLSQAISTTYLMSCIEVARQSYKQDKVIKLIKHPLFLSGDFDKDVDISEIDIFAFENYVLANRVDFKKFLQPIVDNEKHEIIRKQLVNLVNPFIVAERDGSAKTIVKASISLLSGARDTLNNIIAQKGIITEVKDKKGQLEEANKRAYDILIEVLKETADMFLDEKMKLFMFEQHLKTIVFEKKIAMLPRFIDSVFVGDINKDCILKTRIIFVVGASSSNMSTELTSDLLSQRDMDYMGNKNIEIYPTDKDLVLRSRFMFVDLLTKFEDRLYISYSEYNLGGELEAPSDAFKEVTGMLKLEPKSLLAKYSIDKVPSYSDNPQKAIERLEDICCYEANTLFTFLSNINVKVRAEEVREREKLLEIMYASLNSANKIVALPPCKVFTEEKKRYIDRILVKDGDALSITASRLEAYFRCPYSFFIQYGAKAKKRDEGELEVADIGTIMHAVLEEYFKHIKENNIDYSKLKNKIEVLRILEAAKKRAYSNIPNFDSFVAEPEIDFVLQNLEKELENIAMVLTSNVAKGEYRPEFFELEFNSKNNLSVIIEADKEKDIKLSIRGVIDRVDIYRKEGKEEAIMVIDYKSGSSSKQNHQASRICTGLAIQPYIYLMALRNKYKDIKAGGALYLPLSDRLNSKGLSYNFAGVLVANDENIYLVDREAYDMAEKSGTLVSSSVLPYNIKAKNNKDKNTKGEKPKIVSTTTPSYPALEYEDMDYIIEYVKKIIGRAATDIDDGFFCKKPASVDICKNCYVRSACLGTDEENTRESYDSRKLNTALKEKKLLNPDFNN